MLGLLAFDQVTKREAEWEENALIVITGLTCGICYDWMIGGWFFAHMAARKFVGSRIVAYAVMAEVVGYVAWSLLGG